MRLGGRILVATVLSIALWSGAASAQGPGRPGMHGVGGDGFGMLQILIRSAGLSDNQRAQVRQIMENHRSRLQTLREELRVAQQQLGDRFYGASAVTSADLAPLAQQISQLRDQMTQEWLQVGLEVRNMLTPEQQARAAQVRQRLNQLRSEMRTLMSPQP